MDISRKGCPFYGSVILGGMEVLKSQHISNAIIVAFGDCLARKKVANWVEKEGFDLIKIIHPASIIAVDVTIASGVFVGAGVVLEQNTNIGKSVILNTGAIIGCDTTVDAGVHVSPRAVIGNNVTIGTGTWIGMGAVIDAGVRIGANSIVGAGSKVYDSIPDNVVAYGAPCQVIGPIVNSRIMIDED